MKSANSLKTSKRYFKEILTILKLVSPKVRIPNTFPTLLSKINSLGNLKLTNFVIPNLFQHCL